MREERHGDHERMIRGNLGAKMASCMCPPPDTRPHGSHVAKLAGLPKAVTARAEEVLCVLEKGEQGGALARLADDLPLFSAARRHAAPAPRESAAEALLRETRPDELTPREALDLIYRLKGMAAE